MSIFLVSVFLIWLNPPSQSPASWTYSPSSTTILTTNKKFFRSSYDLNQKTCEYSLMIDSFCIVAWISLFSITMLNVLPMIAISILNMVTQVTKVAIKKNMQHRYHWGLSLKASISNSPSASIYQFRIESRMKTSNTGVIIEALSSQVFNESINIEQPIMDSPAKSRIMNASMSRKVYVKSLMQNEVLSNSLSQSKAFKKSVKTENAARILCSFLKPLSFSAKFVSAIHAVDPY